MWGSLGVGLYGANGVSDGQTASTWDFGNGLNWQYRASLEMALKKVASFMPDLFGSTLADARKTLSGGALLARDGVLRLDQPSGAPGPMRRQSSRTLSVSEIPTRLRVSQFHRQRPACP